MNERPEEHPSRSAEDEEFLGRLVEHYSPPPLSAARRAALDAELRGRIATPRELAFARPVFASALAGLAIGLVLVFGAFESTEPESARSSLTAVNQPSAAAWEPGLFDPESFADVDADDDLEELPDDYAAIAGIFLDG